MTIREERAVWAQWAQRKKKSLELIKRVDPHMQFAVMVSHTGNRFAGKTFGMANQVFVMHELCPEARWVFIDGEMQFGAIYQDAMGEYHTEGSNALPPEKTIVYSPETFVETFRENVDLVPFHVIDTCGIDEPEMPPMVRPCLQEIIAAGGLNLVTDEVQTLSKTGLEKDFKDVGMLPELHRIASRGRHIVGWHGRGVSWFYASQEAANYNRSLRNKTNIWYGYQTQRDHDERGVLDDFWKGPKDMGVSLKKLVPPQYWRLEKGGVAHLADSPELYKQLLVVEGISVPS